MSHFNELMSKVAEALQDKDAFMPYELPAALAGLTPAFLADLYDLGLCYGLENYADENLARRVVRLCEPAVYLAVSADRSRPFIFVGQSVPTAWRILLKNGLVIWDRRLSLSAVVQAKEETDRNMAAQGYTGPDGRRHSVMDEHALPLLVADRFPEPTVHYRLGPLRDAEQLIARFDRPDTLAVVRVQSDRILCLRSSAAAVGRFRQTAGPAGATAESVHAFKEDLAATYVARKYS